MSNVIPSKLAIEKYNDKLILNKPNDITAFDNLLFDSTIQRTSYDFILVFIFSLDEFKQTLKKVVDEELLNPNGCLYFAYPKKGNKQYKKYIGRDDFFSDEWMDVDGYVPGSAIKFNQLAAFNDVFTLIGLKNQGEKKKKSSQPSQCVGDYIDRIPDLQKHFAGNEVVLSFFNKLAPGYQRGWARYVYSTKSEETILKRLRKMQEIVELGFKSNDLYLASKK